MYRSTWSRILWWEAKFSVHDLAHWSCICNKGSGNKQFEKISWEVWNRLGAADNHSQSHCHEQRSKLLASNDLLILHQRKKFELTLILILIDYSFIVLHLSWPSKSFYHLQVLAEACGAEITERLMLPTILTMATDLVANVRFNVAKTLTILGPNLTPSVMTSQVTIV